jgi:hypothetical protein
MRLKEQEVRQTVCLKARLPDALSANCAEIVCAKLGQSDPTREAWMRAGSKLMLLAAGLATAFMPGLPLGSAARAQDSQGTATPTRVEQQTKPPATGGCPYRGGKLELIA